MNSQTIRERIRKIPQGGGSGSEMETTMALWKIAAQLAEMNEREYSTPPAKP